MVPTVIPWANEVTSPAARPARSRAAVTASITPRDWSSGVVGAFAVVKRPSTTSTASVNVPPTSTPSSMAATLARGRHVPLLP